MSTTEEIPEDPSKGSGSKKGTLSITDAFKGALKTEKDRFEKLQQCDAVAIVPEKVPLYLSKVDNEAQSTDKLQYLIRTIIQSLHAKDPKQLESLTEDDLRMAVHQISTKEKLGQIPDFFIRAPTLFGSEQLSQADFTYLRSIRKDARDGLSVEVLINVILRMHKTQASKYSETSLIEGLQILMPSRVLPLYGSLMNSGCSLDEILCEIQQSYGSGKSMKESLCEIQRLISETTNPLNLIEELSLLLDFSMVDKSMLTEICLAELRTYLKKAVGAPVTHCLFSSLEQNGRPDFKGLKRLAQSTFKDDLNVNLPALKVHEVKMENNRESRLERCMESIASRMEEMTLQMHALHNAQTTVRCYHCGENHFVKDCPIKGKEKRPNGSNGSRSAKIKSSIAKAGESVKNAMYSLAQCVLHPQGNHKNQECRAQVGPCSHKPTHVNHTQGACRRTITPADYQNGGYKAPNHMNNRVVVPPPQWANTQYTYPPPPPTHHTTQNISSPATTLPNTGQMTNGQTTTAQDLTSWLGPKELGFLKKMAGLAQ